MKFLICDDHALFRDGLRFVARGLAADCELIEASGAEEALELAHSNPDLDLVLMDLQMPGLHGAEGLRRFRTTFPELPIAIVSASESAAEMRAALDGGASGFIPKSLTREAMEAAIRLVLSGGVFVPTAALASPEESRQDRRRERTDRLTPRQLEVLALMARGLTNREICGVLEIAENTVKTHVKAILEVLEATNRTEAAVLARELGLKTPGEE